ncbi:MAG: hypothetical protein K6A23_13140, partial [Butyrivibrio sp.]|nr:hypothetical protein [Butyrivibrio sp.]
DLVWDAGFDDNASGRATISINMSENKGTAQSALSSAIYAFSGDYNGSYLVNNYWAKGLSKSYNEVHNWEFGVTAKPLGILECDQKSLLDYAIPEYMTKGPEATGYCCNENQ